MMPPLILSTLNKLRLWPLTVWRSHRSLEQLERVQLRKLKHVLAQAYRDVPLYGRKFRAAGVKPEGLKTLADLQCFPMTEKDEVRDGFPHDSVRRGTDLDLCRIQQTSGSSGQCMEIAIDRATDDHRALFTQRMYGVHGFRFWRKMAYLFPYPLPLQHNLGLYRNRHVSTSLPPMEIVARLAEFRPHLLAATPSDLLELCEGAGHELHELGLSAVCVHSEPMSSDERSFLSKRFGCPVSTNYYCNEVWAIGCECRAGTMHQFLDNVVLEVVDDDGTPVPDGELGHVLVTSLSNHAHPFIRYRLGDLAIWARSGERCECGWAFPAIDRIEGRDDDYIEHPDGRRIHPSKLASEVKRPCFAYPGIQIFRDYRIVQDAATHVSVQIVPGRDSERFDECARTGCNNLRDELGPEFTVDLDVVEKLDRGSGGKRKLVERTFAGEEGV